MAKRDPEEHFDRYVINYYGGLMTRAEGRAHLTFLAEAKVAHGYSPDSMADRRTKDPEALSLMHHGVQAFRRKVRERILRDHRERIFLNYCPKCGGLAKTPRARQCFWCFHDWHDAT